jgi:transposase-like protein
MKDKAKFTRNVQPYPCKVCGKLTTYDGRTGESAGMCEACHELAGWENMHSDGHTCEEEKANCPFCKEEAKKVTQGHMKMNSLLKGVEISHSTPPIFYEIQNGFEESLK